mmetsp:Transcript_1484/g.3127  ORF Transcript_1484/g.3127 Transcript_1484/m.3127 type:complete len:737 (-) Transcript_1484:81-2291(-)
MEVDRMENGEDGGTNLVDKIREIERGSPLDQLFLSQQVAVPSNNNHDQHSQDLQSLLTLINSNLADGSAKREPKSILVDTCSHLIKVIESIYEKQKQRQSEEGSIYVANPMGMDALQRALSVRISALPKERSHDIDGCTSIINPPDEFDQMTPSKMVKEVKDHIQLVKKVGRIFKDYGAKLSVDQIQEKGPKGALLAMFDQYSAEDCLKAFCSLEEGYDDDQWIKDYATSIDAADSLVGSFNTDTENKTSNATEVCTFAGIFRALKDHQSEGKTWGKDYFRQGGWDYEDLFYGVKLGAILEHAKEQADKMLMEPPSGTQYSAPFAKFHCDVSEESVHPKRQRVSGVSATPKDIRICRAQHCHIKDRAFGGSRNQWSYDGTIGFSHIGSGYRGTDFHGRLYSFDRRGEKTKERGFVSTDLYDEFWGTPNGWMISDSTTNTVWINADQRIKGFSINQDTGNAYTSYIFNVVKTPKQNPSKREKVGNKGLCPGDVNLMLLGSNRIGYLNNYVLQEWSLNEANSHDGTSRMYTYDDDDHSRWPEEDILDLSDMDDSICGETESTRGAKPNSVRSLDVVVPSSIGYLADNQLAFSHEGSSQIPIYDNELREVSRLVGFGGDEVEIVQRPTFERAGDKNTFVASDSSCVKIFDLRSNKAVMTIKQQCVYSMPMYLSDAKFVCNKLRSGEGAMIWDLRSQKPLYSLPISSDIDVDWVPALEEDPSKPPILLTSTGKAYKYGLY